MCFKWSHNQYKCRLIYNSYIYVKNTLNNAGAKRKGKKKYSGCTHSNQSDLLAYSLVYLVPVQFYIFFFYFACFLIKFSTFLNCYSFIWLLFHIKLHCEIWFLRLILKKSDLHHRVFKFFICNSDFIVLLN